MSSENQNQRHGKKGMTPSAAAGMIGPMTQA
jgi:hypothetical protein